MQLVQCALGGVKMGDVDRVEGPAEDSGSHAVEDRSEEGSPAATPAICRCPDSRSGWQGRRTGH
jgi:hypothetical protein